MKDPKQNEWAPNPRFGFPELICLGTAGNSHKTLGEPFSNPARLLMRRADLQSDNLSKLSYFVCEIRINGNSASVRGFLGGSNRVLNIKLLLPSRHLVGLINKSMCSHPSFPKTELGFLFGTKPVKCATISSQQGLCDE